MLRRVVVLLALLTASAATSAAQWQLQDAHTTADLRGIDNVGNGVAWASGSDGTILRTEDAGFVWQLCAKPPGGEHLDFRAIQAFDNNTAIIMSSGKGDLSRLYKTTDGCQSWKLVFTNPDKDGFWDALSDSTQTMMDRNGKVMPGGGVYDLLGDPVNGKFPLSTIVGSYSKPNNFTEKIPAKVGEVVFAASNSSLLTYGNDFLFATGGRAGARVVRKRVLAITDTTGWISYPWSNVPVGDATASSGIFSLAASQKRFSRATVVAVGGDYESPNDSRRIAASSNDGGKRWRASEIQPHGYRSAVAYDSKTKTWITVGPNGTDISTDDGRNWRALKPDAKFNDTPDADQHWNALSLPYAVGPHGRIGTLRPSALRPTQ
ncbi:MAG TPA: hypothetical protein VFW30_05070 [Bryocella sp.]|nr:hypothetical protein [Bryocella sp.]